MNFRFVPTFALVLALASYSAGCESSSKSNSESEEGVRGASPAAFLNEVNSVAEGSSGNACDAMENLRDAFDDGDLDSGRDALRLQAEALDELGEDLDEVDAPSDYEQPFEALVDAYDDIAEETDRMAEADSADELDAGRIDSLWDDIGDAEDDLNDIAEDDGLADRFQVVTGESSC